LVRDHGTNSYDKPPASGEWMVIRTSEVAPGQEPDRGVPAQEPVRHPVAQESVHSAVAYVPPGGVIPEQPPRSAVAQQPEFPIASNGLAAGVAGWHPNDIDDQNIQHPTGPAEYPAPPLSTPAKVAYLVVLTAMVVSGVVLAVTHLKGHGHRPPVAASATTSTTATTTSTVPPTTTLVLPAALKPTAAVAAADLISSWAADNRAEALSVATAAAVSSLFAGHYTSGLVIDRGCSVAFSPIVCSYGPPGGYAPTDPLYELYVVQAPGGWYVSSATIDN
jgi:hypothetical protein